MKEEAHEPEKVYNIILELNKTGLSYLKYMQFTEAIQFFKKAERIVNDELLISTNNVKINQLAGVTFNNLACYYKKTKKPKVALGYLQKSLDYEVYKVNDWVSTGSTHLNICAIYSYLQKHEDALSHVKLAIELLDKKEYKIDDKSDDSRSYFNIRMLSYYNKAIQQEHLKRYQQSIESYNNAKEIAKTFGNKNVSIVLSCDEAIARIQTLQSTLKKKMINLILKKKQNEERGYGQYTSQRRSPLGRNHYSLSKEKLKKFMYYERKDEQRVARTSTKLITQKINNKSTQKGKNIMNIKEYLNEKCKTESNQPQTLL